MRNRKQREKRQSDVTNYLSVMGYSLFFAIAFCFCLLFIQYLRRPDVLPIRYLVLHVKGPYMNLYSQKKKIAEQIRGGFFSLSTENIRKYLLSESEIKSVDIRRIFPNKLSITIVERKPIAYWGQDAAISNQGIVFSPANFNDNLPLPRFNANNNNKKILLKGYAVISSILSQQNLHVAILSLSDRLSWRLKLTSGAQIVLGQDNHFSRLRSFMGFYPEIVKRYGYFFKADLRYVDGFAVCRLKSPRKLINQ
jgi:cell division protein FtsQ